MHGYFIFFRIFSNADTSLSTCVLTYSPQTSVIASVMKGVKETHTLMCVNGKEWGMWKAVAWQLILKPRFEDSRWDFPGHRLKAAVQSPSISRGNFMTNSRRNVKMLFWSSTEWAEHSLWRRFCRQDLVAAVLFTSASCFVIFPFCPAGPAIAKLSFP